MKLFRHRRPVGLSVLLATAVLSGFAEGIPEPSLVFYGVVRETVNGNRLTVGTIQWRLSASSGGESVVIEAELSNINDQFSYVAYVPMESPLPGRPPTPNTLQLTSTSSTYDRSQVTVNGEPAALVAPTPGTFILTNSDRGKVERVDLTLSVMSADSDGNGLPDDWEQAFFSRIGVDPSDDPDNDGLTNEEEWKAGTDPNDAQSRFAFINIQAMPQIGIAIEWSSTPGKHYTILRSSEITGDFVPIQTGVEATPEVNSYLDTTALEERIYFYLLRTDD